jgi:hypothetical protein
MGQGHANSSLIVIPTHLLFGIQTQMRLKVTSWLILAFGSL